jgi:hypothetical protein
VVMNFYLDYLFKVTVISYGLGYTPRKGFIILLRDDLSNNSSLKRVFFNILKVEILKWLEIYFILAPKAIVGYKMCDSKYY